MKFKDIFKKHKVTNKINKKVVAAMIAAAVFISALVGVTTVKSAFAKDDVSTEPITVEAANQDIQKTLSATGTIISAEEATEFATTASSYPIAEVYVKVGDVVKKGDPLYKLDMTTMEEQLKYQQEALTIQNQQNQLANDAANRAFETAKESGAISINDANRALAEAKQSQTVAARNQKSADDALGDARKAESNASNAYNSAVSELNDAKSKLSSLQSQLAETNNMADKDEEGNPTDKEAKVKSLNDQIKAANDAVTAANDKVSSASKDVEAAKSSVKSAESTLNSARDTVATANRTLDGASQTAGKAKDDADNALINSAQTVKNGELSAKASTISNQQEIAKSKEELKKAVVYASMDGTVTNVNIKVGQNYSGTDAVVIDNVNSLKASADIDEAQIPSIEVGQKVEIKTDATGDEILKGTVCFVSPTATKNSNKTTEGESNTASVSKSRATYRVDVTLDDVNPSLRLGMTAKMTFIIANKTNVLAVPSADIQTDLDGSRYVVVLKKNGTQENVPVEVGICDDFFSEITNSKLKAGDQIVEETSDGSDVIDSMGADGGIYIE